MTNVTMPIASLSESCSSYTRFKDMNVLGKQWKTELETSLASFEFNIEEKAEKLDIFKTLYDGAAAPDFGRFVLASRNSTKTSVLLDMNSENASCPKFYSLEQFLGVHPFRGKPALPPRPLESLPLALNAIVHLENGSPAASTKAGKPQLVSALHPTWGCG